MSRAKQSRTDRVMIDIETLGTEPGCAILSIGAVHFTAAGRGETLYRNIDRASCEDAGLEIDEETVKWWSEQDEAAQAVLSGGGGLRDALIDVEHDALDDARNQAELVAANLQRSQEAER